MDFWKNKGKPTGEGRRKYHGGHLWLLGVLTGMICIGAGAVQGQFAVIWKKAVMICLECIGIG